MTIFTYRHLQNILYAYLKLAPQLEEDLSDDILVPDKRSRVLEVVVVRRIINLGAGNLEWGRNGKGLRKGEVSLRVTWD